MDWTRPMLPPDETDDDDIIKFPSMHLNLTDMYVCRRCGAIVYDPAIHKRSHTMSMLGLG